MYTKREAAGARQRLFKGLAALFVGGVTAGCSSVTVSRPDRVERDLSVDEFRAYVEQVFRYQNRVVNDLIVFYEEGGGVTSDTATQLMAAEEASMAACRPLNEVITTYIEGGAPDLLQKQRLVATIGQCEYSVEQLDDALMQDEPLTQR